MILLLFIVILLLAGGAGVLAFVEGALLALLLGILAVVGLGYLVMDPFHRT